MTQEPEFVDPYILHSMSSAGVFIPDVHYLPIPFPQDYEELHREHQVQMQVAAIRNFTAPSNEELGHYYARRITEVAIVVFNASAYCEYIYDSGKHIYRLEVIDFESETYVYTQIKNDIEFQGLVKGLVSHIFNYRLNETIKLI